MLAAFLTLCICLAKQKMKAVTLREKEANRIITLVEDTAYSIPFNHLKIGSLVAAGGAGQVYEGTFSGQPVAIKELFSVLFDPEFLEDLKAEAVSSSIVDCNVSWYSIFVSFAYEHKFARTRQVTKTN